MQIDAWRRVKKVSDAWRRVKKVRRRVGVRGVREMLTQNLWVAHEGA